jgi:hypothetical protein
MDGADAVRYILSNNIDGVIIECGVGSGNFEVEWINELKKHGTVRDIYLFDTFQGLTEPGEFDHTCEDAILYKRTNIEILNEWKKNIISENINNLCYTPLNIVKSKLYSTGYPQDKLHYIVGDVMKTLNDKTNIPNKIAILRLDTDWYESSKIELEKLYDNVVTGGVIIFDDYYHWYGQRRATDNFSEEINVKYNFINLGNGKTAAIIKK